VKKGFEVVASASKTVADVTKAVVNVAGHVLVHAGTLAVNEVQKYQLRNNHQSSEELKAAGRFFLKSAQAMATVYDGVVEGAETVLEDVSTSTVDIASHKYGTQVGETTKAGMAAVSHTYGAVKKVAVFDNPTTLLLAVSKNAGQKVAASRGLPSSKNAAI